MEGDAGHGIVFNLLQIQWPTTVFLSSAVVPPCRFSPFFHCICSGTFRDENSEKNIRAQTLQEVSLSLFSLMALISFSFSLLKRKEEL